MGIPWATTGPAAAWAAALGLTALAVACRPGPEALAAAEPSAPADAAEGRETPPELPAWSWSLEAGQQAALVGQIWSRADARFMSEAELFEALRPADYVLLGEIHDNPDHHRLQARVLRALRGRHEVVAFEMLDADQLDAARPRLEASASAEPSARASTLAEAVAWAESGWPAFELYAPIFEVALELDQRIVAAGLTRAQLAPLFRGEPVEPELARRYGLDEALPVQQRDAWLREMADAHCGAMPPEALTPMLDAQRLRDANMAEAMLQQPKGVLIAGGGHTRPDRAVPTYLARARAKARIATLRFVEVQPGGDAVEDYPSTQHDFLWFTPRAERHDPCEALRARHGASHEEAAPASTADAHDE